MVFGAGSFSIRFSQAKKAPSLQKTPKHLNTKGETPESAAKPELIIPKDCRQGGDLTSGQQPLCGVERHDAWCISLGLEHLQFSRSRKAYRANNSAGLAPGAKLRDGQIGVQSIKIQMVRTTRLQWNLWLVKLSGPTQTDKWLSVNGGDYFFWIEGKCWKYSLRLANRARFSWAMVARM